MDFLSIQQKVENALRYTQRLSGIPYSPWSDGSIGSGPPFWVDSELPPVERVREDGMNCIGLINLVSLSLGNHARDNWFEYLSEKGVLEKYRANRVYPRGTLLIRPYASIEDQGHVAITVSDFEIMNVFDFYYYTFHLD